MTYSTKKTGEKKVVAKYLVNSGLDINDDLFDLHPEEPADICYDRVGYQVVNSDFDFQKNINVYKISNTGRNPAEVFNDFVLRPIVKKSKYAQSANGYTLLIDTKLAAPKRFIYNQLASTDNNQFNVGFKEIYLVFSDENIKIYPL